MKSMSTKENKTPNEKCPDCKWENRANASICKNCGKEFQNISIDAHTGDYESYKYGEKIQYD